jgi:hypothetical protein
MKLIPCFRNGAIALLSLGLVLDVSSSPSQAGGNGSANSIQPAIQTNSPDNPACYIQTSSGQVIDLSQKCGFIKPSVCGTSLGSASRDAVLADFCRQNQRCVLTNTCNAMPRGVNTPPPGTPMGFVDLPKVTA